jgi:hypothetical protein
MQGTSRLSHARVKLGRTPDGERMQEPTRAEYSSEPPNTQGINATVIKVIIPVALLAA